MVHFLGSTTNVSPLLGFMWFVSTVRLVTCLFLVVPVVCVIMLCLNFWRVCSV